MGNQSDHDPMNSPIWRSLAISASRMLNAADRDAVLGDLAEARERGGVALRSVLGVVARRQAERWNDWAPWLALMALAAPLGVLLSLSSRRIADHSALYLWLYVNNWNSMFVENFTFRRDLFDTLAGFALTYLIAICLAWTGGFAVGCLSRGATVVNGAIFCVASLAVELPLAQYSGGGANAAVFESTFYRVVFPWIVLIALALVPALLGMRQGVRAPDAPARWARSYTVANCAALAVSLLVRIGGSRPQWTFLWYGFAGHFWRSAIYCWPAVYLFAIAVAWVRWRPVPSKENHA
jgi:hypothetical protein